VGAWEPRGGADCPLAGSVASIVTDRHLAANRSHRRVWRQLSRVPPHTVSAEVLNRFAVQGRAIPVEKGKVGEVQATVGGIFREWFCGDPGGDAVFSDRGLDALGRCCLLLWTIFLSGRRTGKQWLCPVSAQLEILKCEG
jgi:hypothetical protein